MDNRTHGFRQFECLKPVILRSLGRNKILILRRVRGNSFCSMTKMLIEMSENLGIPLSTLKSNARELRRMELVEFGGVEARLTDRGVVVLGIVGESFGSDYDNIALSGGENEK